MCNNPTCSLDTCNIAYGLCHCGCGGKTEVSTRNSSDKGWVKGHNKLYINHHHTRLSPVEYIIDEETGCWEWQRHKNPKGYGLLQVNTENWLAHRYYYAQKYGPIEEGMQLDHICRNPSCVNPEHLEPVEPKENTRRGKKTILSVKDVLTIRQKYINKEMSQTELAKIYNVGVTTICAAINKQNWKDI